MIKITMPKITSNMETEVFAIKLKSFKIFKSVVFINTPKSFIFLIYSWDISFKILIKALKKMPGKGSAFLIVFLTRIS